MAEAKSKTDVVGHTVLIVDDEPEILRTLRNYLRLNDYNVLTAESGAAALEIMRQEKVHIVLSDIKMPGMSGLELLKRIRAMDFSIQVIMMTGYSTFDITLQALEHGACDYILKPFEDLDDLVHLLEIASERLTRWRRALAGSSRGKGGSAQ